MLANTHCPDVGSPLQATAWGKCDTDEKITSGRVWAAQIKPIRPDVSSSHRVTGEFHIGVTLAPQHWPDMGSPIWPILDLTIGATLANAMGPVLHQCVNPHWLDTGCQCLLDIYSIDALYI